MNGFTKSWCLKLIFLVILSEPGKLLDFKDLILNLISRLRLKNSESQSDLETLFLYHIHLLTNKDKIFNNFV